MPPSHGAEFKDNNDLEADHTQHEAKSYVVNSSLPPALGSQERILAERMLVRKLDFRLLPAIVAIYILNYIDAWMTTARLQGFEQDLRSSRSFGQVHLQYSVVLSILYVVYAPAQIPSNMILNKITRPSIYIGACVIAWGLTSTLTGITTNYGGILACRIFLAIPEAAFYPGAVYLLSCWYTKRELTLRTSILYAGLIFSNAFGSLVAAGIFSGMEGVRGIRAWRWLFLIEGSITMSLGFIVMWILPDYPYNTRWMTPSERRLAQTRIAEDAGEADRDTADDSSFRGLQMAVQDPLVILFALAGLCQLLGNSFGQFFPTLAATLGFNTTVTLLLASAPWVLAGILCCVNAWHADKTGERFFHIAGWWWVVMVGLIVSLSTMSTPPRYLAMFLMACGSSAVAMFVPWVANAVPRPPAKRAAAIAIVNGISNLGTCIGSFTWKALWGPRYHWSMIISLGSLTISTGVLIVIRQILVQKNKQLESQESTALATINTVRVEDAAILEGITLEEAMERRRGFRYLY
ncbi:MFS general substrate transporter [Mycena metata]|uniref:MFS general substrate transporter n=1 Tax=Mycena metata TaxID=1033252 RepID=A0AAD7I057_9AGAR|nr:MFS general substrate transporter [Mycena metata]